MKIGILGGTFDPIHLGHLIIAENVREQLDLNKVIFIPAAIPPHKTSREIIHQKHRLNMVLLATEKNPFFEVSDLEIRKGGISYSVETLKIIQARIKVPSEYFFIIGSDSLSELYSWKDIDQLAAMCNFVVVARPGFELRKIEEMDLHLSKETENRVLSCLIETNPIGISSTDIRERVKKGQSIKYLVLPAVEKYIYEHNLYKK